MKKLLKKSLDDHICRFCNAEYALKNMLWRHIRETHPTVDIDVELKTKVCRFCGKSDLWSISQHEKLVHGYEENVAEPPLVTFCIQPRVKKTILEGYKLSIGVLYEPNQNDVEILAMLNKTHDYL